MGTFCFVAAACKVALFSRLKIAQSLIKRTLNSKGLKIITSVNDKFSELGRKVNNSFKENIN
jgi:hypothetical protein